MSSEFQLGPWVVQPDQNSISRNGKTTRLEPKMVEVLLCLAERAEETVSKEQLIRKVWGDTFVTDDVLTRCISELRRTLEDDAKQPHIIETIPRRGYRLMAEVKPLTTRPRNWPYALVIVASLMVLALFLMSRSLLRPPPRGAGISRLTSSGKVPLAAISPDGKYLAYSEDDGDRQSLWLRQISSGSSNVLLPPVPANFGTIRFSSDSNFIYYTRSEGNGGSALYQIPTLGVLHASCWRMCPSSSQFLRMASRSHSYALTRRLGSTQLRAWAAMGMAMHWW